MSNRRKGKPNTKHPEENSSIVRPQPSGIVSKAYLRSLVAKNSGVAVQPSPQPILDFVLEEVQPDLFVNNLDFHLCTCRPFSFLVRASNHPCALALTVASIVTLKLVAFVSRHTHWSALEFSSTAAFTQ